jgi:hypothetical protein
LFINLASLPRDSTHTSKTCATRPFHPLSFLIILSRQPPILNWECEWMYMDPKSFLHPAPFRRLSNSFNRKNRTFAYLFLKLPQCRYRISQFTYTTSDPNSISNKPLSSQCSPCLSSKTTYSESYRIVLSYCSSPISRHR